jgi:hypothetical protein
MNNKSRVTIKSLKADLENLKVKLQKPVLPKGENHKAGVHDIKNSYIQNMHMRSSMMYLWLFSWVVYLANKIPYLSRIVTVLSLVYGRTTWWKILVKLRKLFVVFNALIGMYVVYKTTGFGVDSFWNNFIAIGEKYVDIFLNFNKVLFNWLLDLFDYKLIPGGNTPPKLNGNNGTSWNILDALNKKSYKYGDESKDFISLREIYMKSENKVDSSSWYTWFYYGTVFLGGAVVLGACYFGYKMITEPGFWLPDNHGGVIPRTNVIPPSSIADSGSSDFHDSTNTIASILSRASSRLSRVAEHTNQFLKKLNPLTWYPSVSDLELEKRLFNLNQENTNLSNNSYYPFREIHPYDSWFKKLRISWLGETTFERKIRHLEQKRIWELWFPSDIELNKPTYLTPISTPRISHIGLGLESASTSQIAWMVNETTSPILNKFSTLPTTPSGALSPLAESILPYIGDGWIEHTVTEVAPSGREVLVN